MVSIFHFFLNLIEFNYKRKIISVLKKNLPSEFNVFFDIGAHKGETSIEMYKNFSIKKSYLFEPIIENFKILEKNVSKLKLKNNLELFNFALGEENKETIINEVFESSSSTLNDINEHTKYFKRKKKILQFFTRKKEIRKKKIKIVSFLNFIKRGNINKIDFIKIDTEGFEYKILRNLGENLQNVGVIQFEHHYDLMILKNYNFRDINNLLIRNGFRKLFKSKMMFRKSFEYIYINSKFKFD
tara:strand:- start:7388 stop:8113 length:726 start_codon:yes stop_codon:yes gene_type:complete